MHLPYLPSFRNYNNLEYVSNTKEGREDKDRTIRFSTSDNLVCFQTPGGSNNPPDRRYLKFLASGNGSLKVTFDATSAGRHVLVSVAGTVLDTQHEASTEERNSFTETITATEGDPIIVFADASLRIFEVSWTPEGYDPDATWPIDETAINEEYIKDFKEDAAEFPDKLFTGQASTVGKFTIMPRTSDEKTKFEDGKLKFGGASKYDEETMIPTDRYLSFKITQPGTIYHKTAASGGGDDSPTRHFVIALLLPGQEKATVLYDEVKTQSGDDDFLTVQVTASHLAGITSAATVYFYCYENAINIEGAGFVPAQ